jgi:hypothetical protein
MIKIIDGDSRPKVIEMRDMKPLQVARIVEGCYTGNIVMRTASRTSFEIMDLTKGTSDSCWLIENSLKVTLEKSPVIIKVGAKMVEILHTAGPKRFVLGEMKPLQVAKVVDGAYKGNVVMRTASEKEFEVINLTLGQPDQCWDEPCSIVVELLDEPIFLEINNGI